MSRPRDQEVIWAAGFMEGEGFFQNGRWVMGANQVNKEPLERLHALWGGAFSKRKQDPKVRRSWWGWEITGKEKVLSATREILPWLTEDRKSRIPWIALVQDEFVSRNVTAELHDPQSRFALYRLCDCPTCGGRGKAPRTFRDYNQPGQRIVTFAEANHLGRCPDCRGEGRIRQEVASAETPEAVGVALVTLAREGEFHECPFGLLDREGEKGKKWLILPWLPSARNVSDAGRVLARSKKSTP